MTKILKRLAALLLVPNLMMDPATAAAFSNSFASLGERVGATGIGASDQLCFRLEALASLKAFFFERFTRKPTVTAVDMVRITKASLAEKATTEHAPEAASTSASNRNARPFVTAEFAAFLRRNGLEDVVWFGDGVRDMLQGKEIQYLLVTFLTPLNDSDEILKTNAQEWNKVLGHRLEARMDRFANALGATLWDFQQGRARFHGLPVRYAGPYWNVQRNEVGEWTYFSRLGVLFDAQRRLHRLPSPETFSPFAFLADGSVIEEPSIAYPGLSQQSSPSDTGSVRGWVMVAVGAVSSAALGVIGLALTGHGAAITSTAASVWSYLAAIPWWAWDVAGGALIISVAWILRRLIVDRNIKNLKVLRLLLSGRYSEAEIMDLVRRYGTVILLDVVQSQQLADLVRKFGVQPFAEVDKILLVRHSYISLEAASAFLNGYLRDYKGPLTEEVLFNAYGKERDRLQDKINEQASYDGMYDGELEDRLNAIELVLKELRRSNFHLDPNQHISNAGSVRGWVMATVGAVSAAALGIVGLALTGHGAAIASTAAGLWSFIAAVPWWGWGLVAAIAAWVRWFFSPIRRVRLAARIRWEVGLPNEVKLLIRRFGPKPFFAIVEASGKNAEDVFLYGFPAVKEKIQGPDDLKTYGMALAAIAKARGSNARDVLERGLPAVKDLIARYGIEPFVTIAQTSGSNAYFVFAYGLPLVQSRVQSLRDLRAYGTAFVEIARASGSNIGGTFVDGLPAIKDLIEHYGIEPFVEIAQVSGPCAHAIFLVGLPLVRDKIQSVGDLRAYGTAFAAIAHACGDGADYLLEYVFHNGFPLIMNHIRSVEDLKAYGTALAEIAEFSRSRSGYGIEREIFEYLLVSRPLIDRFGIGPFAGISRATGYRARYIFHDGLPMVENRIKSKEDFEAYSQTWIRILGNSPGGIVEFVMQGTKSLMATNQIRSPSELEEYGKALTTLAQTLGSRSQEFIRFVLPSVVSCVRAPSDLHELGMVFRDLRESFGEIAIEQLFVRGLPSMHVATPRQLRNKDVIMGGFQIARQCLKPPKPRVIHHPAERGHPGYWTTSGSDQMIWVEPTFDVEAYDEKVIDDPDRDLREAIDSAIIRLQNSSISHTASQKPSNTKPKSDAGIGRGVAVIAVVGGLAALALAAPYWLPLVLTLPGWAGAVGLGAALLALFTPLSVKLYWLYQARPLHAHSMERSRLFTLVSA
jgi:hypothetical protein